MTLHIYSYNGGSAGARALAEGLGIRRIRQDNSRYVGNPNKNVINWGSSRVPPNVEASRVFNRPAFVAAMSNKLRFFLFMSEHEEISLPPWTTNINVARGWFLEGAEVCARYNLSGHSGEGLEILQDPLDNRPAPLYTKYIPKKLEYRVHFALGNIIDVQRKIRDPNREPTTWKVRSHDNGFIFARNGVRDAMPQSIITQAEAVMRHSGLDFGAVDIIYNRDQGAFVLEVNTAPGLEGGTVERYVEAFREYV